MRDRSETSNNRGKTLEPNPRLGLTQIVEKATCLLRLVLVCCCVTHSTVNTQASTALLKLKLKQRKSIVKVLWLPGLN